MLIKRIPCISNKFKDFFNANKVLSQFASPSRPTYYQVLQISETASQTEIKAAYYKLAKQYHPDINKGNEEKFKEVNMAYEQLSDLDKKKLYDEKLKHTASYRSANSNASHQQYPPNYHSGGGVKGLYEQYSQYYDSVQNKNRTREFYDHIQANHYKFHTEFRSKEEENEFKRRMEANFRRSQEDFVREAQRYNQDKPKRNPSVYYQSLLKFGILCAISMFVFDVIATIIKARRYVPPNNPKQL